MKVGADAEGHEGTCAQIIHDGRQVETAVSKIVHSFCLLGNRIQKQGSSANFVESTGK